ncbi:ureidoglycolate dehydrogenase [Haloferax larsenii JCM 13917]|nr:Ldh family oxidoreductase [Haloferax larsenii]ELZ81340.1 ureidoglycolate dehydrogenase [Haloferax larsenii JCM 13917]
MTNSDKERLCVSEEKVRRFVNRALISADVEEGVAKLTTDGLVSASVRGVDSHGIRLLPHYLLELESGRINPKPDYEFECTAPAVGQFDADNTYGIAAGMRAMESAIDLAKEQGSGHVSVRNSSHNGMMAYFSLAAAKEDMIGIAMTHTSANTRPPNSTRPFFGSNPISVAAPMLDEGPFCFDAATSAVTFNEVRKLRDSGEQLPPNVAANADGHETRDPHEATQLLPFGGYKGFGLSMVVEIFTGLLSGMDVGRDVSEMYGESISEPRQLGHYYSAINIDSFTNPSVFKRRLQDLAEEVRSEPRLDNDQPNMIPGDPEKAAAKERKKRGIPISDHDLEKFDEIADTYDLDPLTD